MQSTRENSTGRTEKKSRSGVVQKWRIKKGRNEKMGAELTLHTGCMGQENTIHIDWFDHNNVRHKTRVDIRILDRDKPRSLQLAVNNEVVYQNDAGKEWTPPIPPVKELGRKKECAGQVYIGKCLTSHEPNLWFYYVLLSCDKDNDNETMYWTVAMFMKGSFGAQVVKLTDGEIDKLGYVGHILALLPSGDKRLAEPKTSAER